MDSEGVRQVAAVMNGSDEVTNKLDLELRLGLPDNDENPPKNQGQQFDHTANDHVDWSHLALRPWEEKDNHVPCGGAHVDASGGPVQFEMHDYYANFIKHRASSTGIDLPPNQPPSFPSLPSMIVNNQFVDISHINNMESGTSSSSSGHQKLPIGRRRQGHNNIDNPNKRCANPLCNATASPMWRRGPLGPKTLCNACGIKYRKEEEKMRTRVLMQQLHELATARHKPTA